MPRYDGAHVGGVTITISVDQASIRHDIDRGGVDFRFSEGPLRRRAHVPDEAIADHLRLTRLSPAEAEGFVRSNALKIALVLVGRAGGDNDDEILVDLDLLRQVR